MVEKRDVYMNNFLCAMGEMLLLNAAFFWGNYQAVSVTTGVHHLVVFVRNHHHTIVRMQVYAAK